MVQHLLRNKRRHALTALAALVLSGASLISGAAAAQGATSGAVASPTGNPYKPCMDGSSNEDRATCLKEAGAAKQEAQRGGLTSPGAAADENALLRCDALPGSQKEACRLRILGAGTKSGSVAGGGVLREVVTQTPTSDVQAHPNAPHAMPSTAPMPK